MIKTKIFKLYKGKYKNLSELAQDMGLSVSQIYRVREGKRSINEKFFIGAKKAFPNYKFDDLFYLDSEFLIHDAIDRYNVNHRCMDQKCAKEGELVGE